MKMKVLVNLFVVTLLVSPLVSFAQLSSTNYQVENYSIGSAGQSVDATSTNYQLDLEAGGLYEYGGPATTTPAPTGGGGGGGGSEPDSEEPKGNKKILGKSDSITICHSVKNKNEKYVTRDNVQVFITLSKTGTTASLRGHDGHDNDIIAPFTYDIGDGIDVYLGRNWTSENQILYANDCELFLAEPPVEPPPVLPPPVEEEPETPTTTEPVSSGGGGGSSEDTFDFQFGITATCNRAFSWNELVSATVYRTIESGSESVVANTTALMPWFIDIDPLVNTNLNYRFLFSNGDSKEVNFTPEQFAGCESSETSVIEEDVDDDQNNEQYIDGIFQDPDGSSVPLAITDDGIVLDTDADGLPDHFWNPETGVSPVILGDDVLFITDPSIAPTQEYHPFERGSYRVKITPKENGLVATAAVSTELLEIDALPEIEPPPLSLFALVLLTITGLGGGLLFTLLRNLRVPFSILHIGRTVAHVWGILFDLLVFGKKKRPWGTVYDSVTRAPLDPAYVKLLNDDGGEVQAEAITDLDGRYGFLVPEGTYHMTVNKTHYEFPSTKIHITDHDVLYDNLYRGGPFDVSDTVVRDIPLDPVAFDWNQYEKMRTHQTKFIHRFDPLIVRILDILFYIGAATMLWQFLADQSILSGILLLIYLILLVHRFTEGGPILYGTIRKSKRPLIHAVVRIMRNGMEMTSKVTDEYGRYIAIVPPGNYTVRIEERKDEHTYETVFEKEVKAKKGVINDNFRI